MDRSAGPLRAQVQHGNNNGSWASRRVDVHPCAAVDVVVGRHVTVEHGGCREPSAGGRGREKREESHERQQMREKGETTEAKAEEAAATEPKAGVILEVTISPRQHGWAADTHRLT